LKCLVEMKDISKEFSGVSALEKVSFQLYEGEVHVLLGENGAGKSTLMKILTGIYEPTDGTIIVGDKEFKKLSPRESVENRISIIYQELSVIDELSIAENIFVGNLPMTKRFGVSVVDYKKMNLITKQLLERVGLKKPPKEIVGNLSISEKQQVEIAKALVSESKIIIMDEPTTSLTIEETNKLFSIIKQLKEDGVGVIYISHRLKELIEIGDRVTVLKDGKYVGTRNIKDVTTDDLVFMMVGRNLSGKFLRSSEKENEDVILEVKGLTRKDNKVRNVNFELYEGEILGFAGLIGSGRTELMNAIYGAEPISKGKIKLFGKEIKVKSPYHAIKLGMGLVTENRRENGFFKNFEIWKNVTISKSLKDSRLFGTWGLTNRKLEKQMAMEQKTAVNIKCSSVDQNITELSGGNQQKVLVGKWLAADSNLIIFDEPTKGIDVGARSEIYKIMRSLTEKGIGVIVVSSDLPELLTICDRIIVFKDGDITATFRNEEATEENIMLAATS
jgi:D-allose transport system ATP-binding protein